MASGSVTTVAQMEETATRLKTLTADVATAASEAIGELESIVEANYEECTNHYATTVNSLNEVSTDLYNFKDTVINTYLLDLETEIEEIRVNYVSEEEVAIEVHEVTLDTNDYEYPFNNAETTIALTTTRSNVNYSVDVYVSDYSGGELGSIRVVDKALNGFKLLHDGSAASVTVTATVRGGF